MLKQQTNDKQIYLNVYDLTEYNYYLHSLGVGAYHSGIQIGNSEYAFGSHNGLNSNLILIKLTFYINLLK